MHIQRRAVIVAVLLAPIGASAGAWGPGSFENDDALDWVADCVRSAGPQKVAAALDQALGGTYIEAPEGSSALAAAEVVAAAREKPSAQLPADVRVWLARQPRSEIARLAPVALQAVDRISGSHSSELAGLWKESKSHPEWMRAIQDLRARLQ